jgi:hypothetical protein
MNPDKKKELLKKAVLCISYPDRSYEKQKADTIPSGSKRSSEIYKLRCSFISRTL